METLRSSEVKTVLSFDALDRDSLPVAGGKAANLGELTRAGFPVSEGFCVTTAAYATVADNLDLAATLDALEGTSADDTEHLSGLASEMRKALQAAPMPERVARSITEAYRELADGAPVPVAVRSSATAEDLPHASFAGQQDTYLNIVGEESLLDAVGRCWASLWTDRAVSYRARNGISHRSVRLAVVVQRMVESEVSGILFTANPLTGKRRQAVLDASPGLGEAIVSGAVNPDHFVVDTATGEIVERRSGDKRMAVRSTPGGGTQQVESEARDAEYCLTDEQVRSLSALGARVADYYGAPQDIEWAIDPDGKTWLVQSRPITTLFPLPAETSDDEFRAYLSLSVVQGVYRPLTPMGVQVFQLISSSVSALAGHPPADRYAGILPLTEAAGRLFFDVTPALRSTFGRKVLSFATSNMEARAAPILNRLAEDPRLSTMPTPWVKILRSVLTVLAKGRIPPYVIQALAEPEAARASAERVVEEIRSEGDTPRTGAERLAEVERILLGGAPRILRGVPPTFIAGLGANALAGKLLGDLATEGERRTVMGALPHNPTTEMNLALWALAKEVSANPAAAQTVRETPPEQLSRDYQSGSLPAQLQARLEEFLGRYGHRGVAEIDVGLPRWAEDPTHILGVLANYLRLEDPEAAPDAQFKQAERRAREMSDTLARRASRKSRLREALIRFLLGRARELAGLREMPKFCIVLLLARARALLWPVGEELAKAGRLEKAEDIFFVSLPEAKVALAGGDLRPMVRQRRERYQQEVARRHVPRILLSDGTEPMDEVPEATDPAGTMRGTPASSGIVEAKAHVILEPTGARLEPGEILVAPSTDPGWTPLFLTAGGLVMEMGGAMSHGAVVAREYGIPAVVGVQDATGRIVTGQKIKVDGSAGRITFEQEDVH